MVWPTATYDVLSRNHGNWSSLKLVSKWARGINEQLLKASGADVWSSRKKIQKNLTVREVWVASTPPVRPRVNLT